MDYHNFLTIHKLRCSTNESGDSVRLRFSAYQIDALERVFSVNPYPQRYMKNKLCRSLNPFRPGGEGRGRKVLVPISTFQNFLNYKVIPTKCGHFYQNILGNKILKTICFSGITCCHSNAVFDAMFTQTLINKIFKANANC